MRLPKGMPGGDTPLDGSVLEGTDPGGFGSPAFYPESLEAEKEFAAFIKKSESAVRRSLEMRQYVAFLKAEMDMDRCVLLRGLGGVDVELHHYPFTMFDLCAIEARRRIRREEPLSTLLVAHEVVHLHYSGAIGMVPLSKTLHELAHAGRLFIPMTAVHGDVAAYVEARKDDLTSDYIGKLRALVLTPPDRFNELAKVVLEVNPVPHPESTLPDMSDIMEALPGPPESVSDEDSSKET